MYDELINEDDDEGLDSKTFDYRIFFRKKQFEFHYPVTISADTIEHAPPTGEAPEWCELEFKQCPNCTLSPIWHKYCPLAVRLVPFVNLPKCNSFDQVDAEVIFDDKKITYDTSAQEAFSSLLGLVMATSGCPHTVFFKPMAWHHRPFSNQDETLFRACTTYLFSYFIHRRDKENVSQISFDILKGVYENIHTINVHIASRIQNYLKTDSAINAIVLLDLITNDLPIAIDEDLTELKKLFESHRLLFG